MRSGLTAWIGETPTSTMPPPRRKVAATQHPDTHIRTHGGEQRQGDMQKIIDRRSRLNIPAPHSPIVHRHAVEQRQGQHGL